MYCYHSNDATKLFRGGLQTLYFVHYCTCSGAFHSLPLTYHLLLTISPFISTVHSRALRPFYLVIPSTPVTQTTFFPLLFTTPHPPTHFSPYHFPPPPRVELRKVTVAAIISGTTWRPATTGSGGEQGRGGAWTNVQYTNAIVSDLNFYCSQMVEGNSKGGGGGGGGGGGLPLWV